MSKNAHRKDIRSLEKRVKDRAEGVPIVARGAQPGLEDHLLDMLMSGGPELAATRRMDSLKTAYMERGTVLRQQTLAKEATAARSARHRRVRTHPALARIAAVATVVVALLVSLGLGSAYAMPGNPLYSVKHAAESAYLSLVPGDQNKADAYASYTNRRLNDLKYVEERGMSNWYYSLARDSEGGIGKAYDHGKRLRAGAAQKMTEKAQALTLRLEGLLGEAFGKMTSAEKANAERGLEQLRLRLRMRRGTPSGPSQQNGQPGNQNGQQNGTPGGPGTQPGSQQQQNQLQLQQTQTDSPSQIGEPGGPSQVPGYQGQQSPQQGGNRDSPGEQGMTIQGQSNLQAQPDVGTMGR
jgi:hypothetical protein